MGGGLCPLMRSSDVTITGDGDEGDRSRRKTLPRDGRRACDTLADPLDAVRARGESPPVAPPALALALGLLPIDGNSFTSVGPGVLSLSDGVVSSP